MSERIDFCRICDNETYMTKEHVPPQSAFNNCRILLQHLEQQGGNLNWIGNKTMQSGYYNYSLCENCNNTISGYYAKSYVEAAKQSVDLVSRNQKYIEKIELNIQPLNFIKQMICCIVVINSIEFARKNQNLRDFILNKRSIDLDPIYDIYLSLYRGNISRYTGLHSVLDTNNHSISIQSEIAFKPFIIGLTIDNKYQDNLGRITYFSNFKLDERKRINIHISTEDKIEKYTKQYGKSR